MYFYISSFAFRDFSHIKHYPEITVMFANGLLLFICLKSPCTVCLLTPHTFLQGFFFYFKLSLYCRIHVYVHVLQLLGVTLYVKNLSSV